MTTLEKRHRTRRIVAASILGCALLAWGVSLVDAFVARRYLHGDASYFLVSMLSAGRIAPWCEGCWHPDRIYAGRMGAQTANELPTLLASRVFPGRLRLLERIYGATLLLHAPLGLLLAGLLVRRKALLVFPAASILLGSLNSGVYVVANAHVLHSLFWVLLLRLLEPHPIRRVGVPLLAVLALPTPIAYETMGPYGLLLLVACVRRLRRSPDAFERSVVAALAAWFLVGVAFAGLSVLYPFDPANRASFLASITGLGSLSRANPGIPVSGIALGGALVVLLWPAAPGWLRSSLVVATAIGALHQGASIALRPEATDFHGQIQGRVMLAIVPVALAAVLVWQTRSGLHPPAAGLRCLALLAGVAGLGQVAWQLQATRLWSGMLDTLRAELGSRQGPIPFPASVAARPAVDGQPVLRLHAQWPLPALSLLLAERGVVQSAIVFRSGAFYPLDLEDLAVLGELEGIGLDFGRYRAGLQASYRLDAGRAMDFGSGGKAWRYEWGDWGQAERGGTWARGPEPRLEFDLVDARPDPTTLRARVGADVGPGREELRATVVVNGIAVGAWDFRASAGDQEPKARGLPLPTGLVRRNARNVILFRIERSGAGPPPRLLFVRLALREDAPPR